MFVRNAGYFCVRSFHSSLDSRADVEAQALYPKHEIRLEKFREQINHHQKCRRSSGTGSCKRSGSSVLIRGKFALMRVWLVCWHAVSCPRNPCRKCQVHETLQSQQRTAIAAYGSGWRAIEPGVPNTAVRQRRFILSDGRDSKDPRRMALLRRFARS